MRDRPARAPRVRARPEPARPGRAARARTARARPGPGRRVPVRGPASRRPDPVRRDRCAGWSRSSRRRADRSRCAAACSCRRRRGGASASVPPRATQTSEAAANAAGTPTGDPATATAMRDSEESSRITMALDGFWRWTGAAPVRHHSGVRFPTRRATWSAPLQGSRRFFANTPAFRDRPPVDQRFGGTNAGRSSRRAVAPPPRRSPPRHPSGARKSPARGPSVPEPRFPEGAVSASSSFPGVAAARPSPLASTGGRTLHPRPIFRSLDANAHRTTRSTTECTRSPKRWAWPSPSCCRANADLFEIVGLSLRVSLTAVGVACTIGLPLGAALAVSRFPGRGGRARARQRADGIAAGRRRTSWSTSRCRTPARSARSVCSTPRRR